MFPISSSTASMTTSKPFTPTKYIIAIIATTSTYITSRSTFVIAIITWIHCCITAPILSTCKATIHITVTSITICTIITIIITLQAPSTTCTASSTSTIATTSTATIATSTIRRTFRMIIKKIPQE